MLLISNIRVRKETGRPILDFRVFEIRRAEQTKLSRSKANRKLPTNIDENIEAAVANAFYQYECFHPISERIKNLNEAQPSINISTVEASAKGSYSTTK